MKKMLRKMIGLSVVMAMVFTLFMPAMVSATFHVTFDLNGGTYTNGLFVGQIGTITRDDVAGSFEYVPEDFIDIELNPEYFRREGYTFKGWSVYREDGVLMDNRLLKGFIVMRDTTLYAQWEKNNEPVPAPQPEPVPVPQPEPVPVPQPEPVPAPQPEPVPAPQPEPVPAPQPEPVPQHSDSEKREVATLAAPSGSKKREAATLATPSGNPKTGDAEILLWAGFMAVSMLGVMAVVTFLKKVR